MQQVSGKELAQAAIGMLIKSGADTAVLVSQQLCVGCTRIMAISWLQLGTDCIRLFDVARAWIAIKPASTGVEG